MRGHEPKPAFPLTLPDPREGRILLCSCNAELTGHLGDALSRRGYNVDRVASAQEALAAIAAGPPDLLLCDDAPPALDAMELLHRLRQPGQPSRAMPVVVLSDFGSPGDVAAGRLAGADDFLGKPVQMDLLDAAILSQLRLVERVRAAVSSAAPGTGEAVEPACWRALAERLAFGIIMAGQGGRLLFANLAARRLAGDRPALLRSWARPQPAGDGTASPRAPSPGGAVLRVLPPGSAPGASDGPLFVARFDLRGSGMDAPCSATLLFSRDWPQHGSRLMATALGLTPTETLVASHLATGKRPEEIAQMMSVTMPTVNYHLRNIYQKSGTTRRVDAVCLLRSVPVASVLGEQPLSGHA